MADYLPNLQVKQQNVEGYDVSDKNGWPTPLVDPAGQLKIKVENGSRGSTKDFKAMRTSRQDDVSLPEGHAKVSGEGLDGLKIEITVNDNDSLSHDTGKGA